MMAWSVEQRTREIGVRIALGARRYEIVMLMLRQGMRLALAGIGAGLLAAASLTRLIASLLYDVKPNDAATFGTVAFGIAARPHVSELCNLGLNVGTPTFQVSQRVRHKRPPYP